MSTDYHEFLASKRQYGSLNGFKPSRLPDFLYPFQAALCDWAIRIGRGAVFAGCGLGKTPIALVWADNVVRETNRPVLIVTQLAVAQQMVREGEKFGIECVRSSNGKFPGGARIVVTNYDRLHHFNPSDFAGVVPDESGGIKDFASERTAIVTEFLRTIPYRLLCSATPAPNDHDELGTSAEALGEMGYRDMATRFFKQQTAKDYLGWARTKYKLKGHAEKDFWRWICSWARAVRKPSDLGFDDGPFLLPPIEFVEHVVKSRTHRPGFLIDLPPVTLNEQREELRRTLRERCEKVAEQVSGTGQPAIVWTQLNPEADLCELLIPGAVQVSGSDRDEVKEERFLAFERGQIRVLVSKPVIAGYGLNWQHCAHATFFPSHSFEAYHQAKSRIYRFGQKRTVRIDMVTTEAGRGVLANQERKAAAAELMFDQLAALMNDSMKIQEDREFYDETRLPSWLNSSLAEQGV